jgi:hypothetical protein
MVGMIRIGLFATLIFFSAPKLTFAQCKDLYRFYAIIDLKAKTIEMTKIDSAFEKFCDDLVIPPNANLEIILSKNKNTFSTKLYRSMVRFWDHPEDNGKWTGGVMPQTKLYIDSFLPVWYKGAVMKIKDIKKDKILSEATL